MACEGPTVRISNHNVPHILRNNWPVVRRVQQFASLKILKAKHSINCKELDVLLYLSHGTFHHPGRQNVMPLLDNFTHHGPNGTHLCLVFPAMLSDLEVMSYHYGCEPHPPDYVIALSKQILLGLDFLHTLLIVHGGKSTIPHHCNSAFDNWLLL